MTSKNEAKVKASKFRRIGRRIFCSADFSESNCRPWRGPGGRNRSGDDPYSADIQIVHRSRTIRLSFLLALALLPTAPVPSKNSESLREVNFGRRELVGRFMPARELELWARNHNLDLVPDSPLRDIQDFEAEVIPEQGADFKLVAPGTGRVFLYLDLVTFRPLSAETMQVQWMDVLVNGQVVRTIYAGGGADLPSPVIIPIDREHMERRLLRIKLRPAPGDGFFALWDAFVSPILEEPGPAGLSPDTAS